MMIHMCKIQNSRVFFKKVNFSIFDIFPLSVKFLTVKNDPFLDLYTVSRNLYDPL